MAKERAHKKRKTKGVRKQLEICLKKRVVDMRNDKKTFREIAETLGISEGQAQYAFANYTKTQSFERREGSGRPRKTTARQDREIVRHCVRHRNATAKDVQEALGLNHMAVSTIRARISSTGRVKSYYKLKKPFVSEANRVKRLNWAREHKDWSVEKWRTVLWSDESPFQLRFHQRSRVWVHPTERFLPEALTGTVKHEVKINVWGCFTAHGVGNLHRIHGNMNRHMYKDILQTQLVPSVNKLFPGNLKNKFIFQQDNDPKHTARIVKTWLKKNMSNVMDWPAQSPDLNPIENLWAILDKRLASRKPKNEEELFETLQEGWNNLDKALLTKLADSMPRRCEAVIKNKGYPTKY